jgi:hypothetical protein
MAARWGHVNIYTSKTVRWSCITIIVILCQIVQPISEPLRTKITSTAALALHFSTRFVLLEKPCKHSLALYLYRFSRKNVVIRSSRVKLNLLKLIYWSNKQIANMTPCQRLSLTQDCLLPLKKLIRQRF